MSSLNLSKLLQHRSGSFYCSRSYRTFFLTVGTHNRPLNTSGISALHKICSIKDQNGKAMNENEDVKVNVDDQEAALTTEESSPENSSIDSCSCLEAELGVCEEQGRYLGQDTTKGRYGDVTLFTCPLCQRVWLFYRVEYEGFTASGRWFRAVISPEAALLATPESADEMIARSEYQIYGGSYFGTAGRAVQGPHAVDIDLFGQPIE